MSKYYNKELSNEIHAVYAGRQSGKSYYEFKKLEQRIKELEEENKKLNELVEFNVKTSINLTKINNQLEDELNGKMWYK